MSTSVFPAPIAGELASGILRDTRDGSGGCKGRPRATVPRESQPLQPLCRRVPPEGRRSIPPVRPTPNEIRLVTAGMEVGGARGGRQEDASAGPPSCPRVTTG